MIREGRGKAILAYFKTPEQAHQAADRLKAELDIIDVDIDRFSATPRAEMNSFQNPINADFSSHEKLIEGTDPSNQGASILRGADPAVSGMSDGGQGEWISGRDILLTVVVPEDKVEQAVQIINACGGQH